MDILVNSAGVALDGLLVRQRLDDIQTLIETNLIGPSLICQAFAAGMVKRRSGSIINIASVVGLKGSSGQSVYGATKAGLVGLTRSAVHVITFFILLTFCFVDVLVVL